MTAVLHRTLVVQTEKGSTTLNLSLLVEGQKGTDRVVLRRLCLLYTSRCV